MSCYNRAREVSRGSNAKGTAPIKAAARLYSTRVGIVMGDKVAGRELPVFHEREAMLVATRKGSAAVFCAPDVIGLA